MPLPVMLKGNMKMRTLEYKPRQEAGVSLENALLQVGPGWAPLIEELYLEMSNYPGIILVQLKEKFGALRIYMGGTPDMDAQLTLDATPTKDFYKIIQSIEKKSTTMCETCGNAGKVVNINGWLEAVCPEHSRE